MRAAVLDLASQPIRNRMIDPRAATATVVIPRWYGASGSGVTTTVAGATDGPLGIPTYRRKTWTVAPTANGATGWEFYRGAPPAYRHPISPGQAIRQSVWTRASSLKMVEQRFYWCDSGGAVIGSPTMSSRTVLAANVWTPLTFAGTAPANTVDVQCVTDVNPSIGQDPATAVWAVGETLDITAVQITDGTGVPAYADPTFLPSWRWTGTVNASESVGWPYTLEGIAGRPDSMWDAAQVSGAGVALPAEGAAVTRWVDTGKKKRDLVQATAANQPVFRADGLRSRVDFSAQNRFLVTEVADVDMPVVGSWYAVIKYPPAQATGVMALTAAPDQNTSMFYESAASNPSYFSVYRVGNSNTPTIAAVHPPDGSRRVFSTRLATNEIQHFVDSYASVIRTGPGTPFNAANNQPTLRMGTDVLLGRDLIGDFSFACVYEGVEHDATTRNRIMAWLARRYGTTVTAGY